MDRTKKTLALFSGLAVVAVGVVAIVQRDQLTNTAPVVVDAAPTQNPQTVNPSKPDTPAAQADIPLPSIGTVRIEKDGQTIVAGRAEPNSDVSVKFNNTIIGSGKANAQGDFAISPDKPLSGGAGNLMVEMKTAAGVLVPSAQSVAVMARDGAAPTVAVLTPGAPTQIVQGGGDTPEKLPKMDTVNIDSVDYDDQGNILFGGRGPAGSKVQLYSDNALLADGMIGPDGTWTIKPTNTISVGAHTLRADESIASGEVKSRVQMPFFREAAATIVAARTPKPQVEMITRPKTVTAKSSDSNVTVTASSVISVPVVPPAKVAEAPAPSQPAEVVETKPAQPAAKPVEALAKPPATPMAEAKIDQPAAAQKLATAEPEVQPPPDATSKLVIQPGQNLWKLSRRIYGKGTLYTVIYEANKQYIRNPDLIYPGQVFTAPTESKTKTQ